MGVNIEIKAKAKDPENLCRILQKLSETSCEVIPQEDIFFHTAKGRLKLRVLAPERGELIYYERDNIIGPKRSSYLISRCTDPTPLRRLLATSLGVRGIVRKQRLLYKIGNTRIHVDDVEGLGCFLEIEVVLNQGQTTEEGVAVAEAIMQKLGIDPADLVEEAYIDLLQNPRT
jgi:predicted adenylyl cyclase CyaB